MEMHYASLSHSGLVRQNNEDVVHTDASLGLALLADGMGGYNAGEVASAMVSTHMRIDLESRLMAWQTKQGYPPTPLKLPENHALATEYLQSSLTQANLAILEASKSQKEYRGMGTTLVLAWFVENQVHVAHVGDSRCYLRRGGQLQCLTRDHTLLQEQLDSGLIQYPNHPFAAPRNLLTRAVGVSPMVELEVQSLPMQANDVFLLCSDGLTDMITDENIDAILNQDLALELLCEQLIEAALERGGSDNVSVILVKIKSKRPSLIKGWWR